MYDVEYRTIAEISSTPDVSIVVPVYNGEAYIRRCLEYLVYQAKQEIEIVVIDNLSEDNTSEICLEMQQLFPEKISLYQLCEHKNTQVYGRNLGIWLAKGEYLMFCDADDIMHFHAAKLAYEYAVSHDYDLVCFPAYRVEGRSIRVVGRTKENATAEDIMKDCEIAFWAKCVRRSSVIDHGFVPEDVNNDDWAYWFGFYESTDKIGFLNVPLYYYIKRSDSEQHNVYSPRKLMMLKSHKYALDSVQENKAMMEYVTARHLKVNLQREWVFLDAFIEHLKDLWPDLSNNKYLLDDQKLYLFLRSYVNNTETPFECRVYLNGFEHSYTQSEIDAISQKAFGNGCEVIVLNCENCSTQDSPIIHQAYIEGNLEFVCQYFALKNICSDGGVFINHNIVIDTAFNFTRCFPSFIGYVSQNAFSPYVFGGHKDNTFLLKLLETYNNNFYEDAYLPLADRMKNILIGCYGYDITGKTDIFSLGDVSILNMKFLSLNILSDDEFNVEPHLCHIKYFDGDENYVVIPRSSWNYVSPVFKDRYDVLRADNQHLRKDRDNKRRERDEARKDRDNKRRERDEARKDRDNKRRERDEARKELDQLKNSRSWRMTAWLRKILWLFKKNQHI